MGVDFITTSKSGIQKGWDKSKKLLSLNELEFTCPPEKIRTVQVVPTDSTTPEAGQQFVVKTDKGALLILQDGVLAGVCNAPPLSLLDDISQLGGCGLGKLDRVKQHSGVWDVAIYLESAAKECED